MEQRVSVITLGVSDLGRARRFYQDGLGWRPHGDNPDVVFFQLPGMVLALWARAALVEDVRLANGDGDGFGGIALAYNTRSAEEVDSVMAEAERAGAAVLKRPARTFWGGYAGYFADPDGHVWEVAHNPFWSMDGEGRISLTGA